MAKIHPDRQEMHKVLGGQKQNQWLEIGKERLRSYQSSVQSLNTAGACKATKEVTFWEMLWQYQGTHDSLKPEA